MNNKSKILHFAEEKFFRSGFYKITMDEIAREMKISKKTIYKYFKSKNELIESVIYSVMHGIAKEVDEIVQSSENAVVKLYKMSSLILKRIGRFSEPWLNDLRVHRPDLWKEMDEFRAKMIMKNFELIVDQGKLEGYVIDQPSVIILTMLIASIQSIVNPDFLLNNSISIKEATRITIDVILSGILTKKGRKLYKKYNASN